MVHHTGVREVPHAGRANVTKSSKSAPHVSFGVSLAGFGIGSIDIHHEASDELSISSEDDDIALRSHLLVCTQYLPQ